MPEDQSPPAGEHRPGRGDVPPHASAPVVSRKELRSRRGSRSRTPRNWWLLLGSVGVVLVAVVVALVTVPNARKAAAAKLPVETTTTTAAPPTGPVCPLTGMPAPGGSVPSRPALGIKIGNYPDDRPSAGLNQADIVFEEPVEGAITRLVAVYQCQGPALVGDLRSAREPDVGILSQLSDPLFVHAGGINPVIALLKSAALFDEDLFEGGHSSAIIDQPGKQAPYSTFVNTSSLWAFDPSDTTAPKPIVSFAAALPAGASAGTGASVHIPFSSTSDVTWTWSPTSHTYLRSYSGQPDILVDGSQTAATNVVIMTVQTSIGPWAENSVGGREVEVGATGSGPLTVMRDGSAITGTWSRTSLTQPAILTASNGTPITLHPGNTWEELVPAGITVTPSSAPSTSSGATAG